MTTVRFQSRRRNESDMATYPQDLSLTTDLMGKRAKQGSFWEEESKASSETLVLKKVTMTTNKNKLTPPWEGPFRIINETGQGAYKLESLEKKILPRTWNAASLRMYYS
ncbi:hypothetical protein CR513_17215, partial [Mucuna pruriens]